MSSSDLTLSFSELEQWLDKILPNAKNKIVRSIPSSVIDGQMDGYRLVHIEWFETYASVSSKF